MLVVSLSDIFFLSVEKSRQSQLHSQTHRCYRAGQTKEYYSKWSLWSNYRRVPSLYALILQKKKKYLAGLTLRSQTTKMPTSIGTFIAYAARQVKVMQTSTVLSGGLSLPRSSSTSRFSSNLTLIRNFFLRTQKRSEKKYNSRLLYRFHNTYRYQHHQYSR